MTQTALFESDERKLLAQLQGIARDPARAAEAGAILIDLRTLMDGRFHGALAQIRPDLKRPDAWADRCIDRCRRASPGPARPQEHAPSSPAAQARADSPRQGPAPPGRPAGRSASTSDPRPLDPRSQRLFEALRPLLDLDRGARRKRIDELAEQFGSSRSTLYRHMKTLRNGDSAASLTRRARRDTGVRLDPDVQQAFLARRGQITHERISWAIRAIQREFPDREISPHSLRRLARSIPKALTMSKQEWRAKFLPGRQWEVPYPNHTHTFDMTIADLFVWDGDPNVEPYRPNLTAMVDEHTHCLMFGLYTKETPSRSVIQALLLHAWLPKPDPKWPMYGAPEHLHCDNGKVQDSHWLEAVCSTLGSDLNLCGDIRHAAVRSPWQQGHIERFFGIVHEGFEAQLGAGYCGPSPDRKPECFQDKSGGLKVWKKYPTLEVLNKAFWIWVVAEYHQLHHRRLAMSRLDAWQTQSRGHVRLPDRDYLYETLLQRAGKRRVTGGRVRLNTYTYWHRALQGYEGADLEVRWDPADLGRALVLDFRGQPLCQAERDERKFVDDPQTLAEHRQRHREIKDEKKVLAQAIASIAPTDERTYREHVEALDEAHRRQVIPFQSKEKAERPKPDTGPTAEDILELHPERPAKAGDDDGFTLHGIPI